MQKPKSFNEKIGDSCGNKKYNVAIYIRLSRESTNYRNEDSFSIENQQAMLSKFITMMPGWVEKRIYIDNGASGANFKRKGFQDMIEDVRQGIINLVLVKDLSRFGRNYLETGKFLEEKLPALGCRFVALSDGVDTETGENDIAPFLNAMNDFYIKNLSDRVKSVLTAKAKDGQKVSGIAPYGYARDQEENTRLIVDEYAAGVVRRIFEIRAKGVGYAAITKILNKDNVLPPRLYYFRRQNRVTNAICSDTWSIRTVKLILNNEIYIGNTISFKRRVRSYRDNRVVQNYENDWIKVENTHKPIIGKGLWQTVQQINNAAKERFAGSREPQLSLFSGILFCADCHTKMGYVVNTTRYKNGRIAKYGGYTCRTHTQSGGSLCSWHKLSERNLSELVLGHIKEMAGMIALDEGRMLQSLREQLIDAYKADKFKRIKEQRELEQQLYILETQLDQLYEDKVSGVISVNEFVAVMEKAEAQHLEIEDRLSTLTQAIEQIEEKLGDINELLKLIKENSIPNEVDRNLIECLIEKIEIGESSVVDGVKKHDVRIFYKYVGLC